MRRVSDSLRQIRMHRRHRFEIRPDHHIACFELIFKESESILCQFNHVLVRAFSRDHNDRAVGASVSFTPGSVGRTDRTLDSGK